MSETNVRHHQGERSNPPATGECPAKQVCIRRDICNKAAAVLSVPQIWQTLGACHCKNFN